MATGGFFDIGTSQDLFEKLRHEYQRILAAPGDRYVAMNFFVTARSLSDWVKEQYNRQVGRCPLLEVCRELANNSKHHSLRYEQVKDTKVVGGAFQFSVFDPGAFDVGHLVVELAGDAEREFGREIPIEILAQKVVEFWQKELGVRSP